MKLFSQYCLLALCLLSLGCQRPTPVVLVADTENRWTPLFDGQTLDGWHVQCLEADRDKSYWSVQDGAIQCDSRGDGDHNYVWLMSDGEYDDFELRLKVQCFKAKNGNSGIQVRSRWDPEDSGGWLNGPQIDIHPPAPFRVGFIYDETRGAQRWIHPSLPDWNITPQQAYPDGKPEGWSFVYADDENDRWNQMLIRCEGTRITTYLNGVQISDYDGKGVLDDEHHQRANAGMSGHFALQLHSRDQILIRFKDIEVRELK